MKALYPLQRTDRELLQPEDTATGECGGVPQNRASSISGILWPKIPGDLGALSFYGSRRYAPDYCAMMLDFARDGQLHEASGKSTITRGTARSPQVSAFTAYPIQLTSRSRGLRGS